MNIINNKHLNLEKRANEFLTTKPFPYLVLDDFMDAEFFEKLQNSLENIEIPSTGRKFNTEVENKKWISLNSDLPDLVQQVVGSLNSDSWVENIKELTKIPSIITTPYSNTKLSNYHVMEPGSVLGPHVDHACEPVKKIPHILNMIVYLTKDWDERNGGGTFFYDMNGEKIISDVSYRGNRAVIFLHTPYSFHGVNRVSTNAKQKRRSIYVDYYSESFSPYENFNLDFNNKWFKHGTTFKLKKYSDYFNIKNIHYTKAMLEYKVNRFKSETLSNTNTK